MLQQSCCFPRCAVDAGVVAKGITVVGNAVATLSVAVDYIHRVNSLCQNGDQETGQELYCCRTQHGGAGGFRDVTSEIFTG